MKPKLKLLTLAIAASSAGLLPEPVVAQGASLTLEEVFVTARRRDEALQDVPISVSAFNPQQIDRLKMERPEDLQFQTPSLMITGSHGDMLQLGIRGQFVNDALGTTDAPVNVYFGEALISRPMGTNRSMYDLASIQVLKGVQGTLFGRNSTGGALIIQPASPSNALEGSLSASAGNYNHRQFEGVFNAPITSTLAMRLALKKLDRDGYAENIYTGGDLEDEDLFAGRLSIQWNPTDNIDSLTIYDHYEHDKSAASAFKLHSIDPNAGAIAGYNGLAGAAQSPLAALFPSLPASFPADLGTLLAQQNARDVRKVGSELGTGMPNADFWGKPSSTAENWGVQNITSFTMGDITIKNILAYREMEFDSLNDLDGSLAPLIGSRQGGQFEFMSEELQIIGSSFDDRLDWLVGLYYMNEEGSDYGISNQFNPLSVEGARLTAFQGGIPGVPASNVAAANAVAAAAGKIDTTSGEVENTSRAVYTGATWHFNDAWSLAGGLRYTEDKREFTATSKQFFYNLNQSVCAFLVEQPGGGFGPASLDQCDQNASETFEKVTYDVTLTHSFDEGNMVYGAYRLGYRAGGFNGRARSFAALQPYNPEEVDEYEIGFKSNFGVGPVPVRLSGAVFYQEYSEIQRQTSVNLGGNTIATVIENAAEGTLEGGELELEIRPSSYASLSLFYSYVDGEFDQYIDSGTGADLSDQWLVLAPKHSVGATLNLFTPLGGMGELVWTLNAYHRSDSHLDDRDTEVDQDAYTLVNASVTWEKVAGSNFDMRLWGRNLGDKEYKVGTVGIMDSAGFASVFYGPPRTYGFDVTWRFGS